MKILITAGGTEESIDNVRSLTNFSTGHTGSFLADEFSKHGHEVFFLHAKRSAMPKTPMERLSFTSSTDLENKLEHLLANKNFDTIFQAAAISDYLVDSIEIDGERHHPSDLNKVNSETDISVHLKKRDKIIDKLKDFAKNNPIVWGFKLTDADENTAKQQAQKLSANGVVDYVIHNDIKDIDENLHKFTVYKESREIAWGNNKKEMFKIIEQLVKESA